MRAIVVARPWVLISVVFYGSAPFSVRAASLCDSLVEDLRKTSCIDLKSTGSNPIDGFKLRRANGCLAYGGYSFDANNVSPGDVSPQNVCRLALYGDQAATYEAPYEILATSFAELSADLEYYHWFGRCTPGGCDTCTNDELLVAGTAWADTFAVGDVCVLTDDDDGGSTSQQDQDPCWESLYCYWQTSPSPAPTLTPVPTVSPAPSVEPTACGVVALSEKAAELRGNYTMFGRLATDACAESLAYGPIAIDNEECSDVFLEYPGFISTESGEQGTWHYGWWQLVTADGFTPLFHIFYHFSDVLTLGDRFSEATSSTGVAVTYEVWDATMGSQLAYFDGAAYHGASGAFETRNPFDATKVSIGFSDDDWCWGAKSGIVDCNAADLANVATVAYGVAVANTDDGACAKLHNGSTTATAAFLEGQGVVTYLLYAHANAPPTPAPTTFFCDFDGSASVFALSLSALVCCLGAVLLALVARLGRCEEAKASFDQDYNLWLSGQQKANHELTEIERVKQMEFEVAQHRRRQDARLAAQRKEAADQALIRTGMVQAGRFASASTTPTASPKKVPNRSPRAKNSNSSSSSSSSDRKKKANFSGSHWSSRSVNREGDYEDDDESAAMAVAVAESLEIEGGARDGAAEGSSAHSLDLDDDAVDVEAGDSPRIATTADASTDAGAYDESDSEGDEGGTGVMAQAPRSAFAPHELLPSCCRWAPDSAGRYFSGPLSSLTIFAGSGPPAPLFLLGAALLALYYNGRSGNSSSGSDGSNSLPGVRCQPSLWYLPPLGVALLCAAVAAVMLRAALMVFWPWWEHRSRQRYGSQLDYLRRRTQLLRFFATAKHCAMCLAQPASTLAQPCGHLALCHTCAAPFRRSRPLPRCVICREPCAYTKMVRLRGGHSEVAAKEMWYRRALGARDSTLDPIDSQQEPLTELRRKVYDSNHSLRNAHAVFKSDLCTDCPASAKLPMVGTRNTSSSRTSSTASTAAINSATKRRRSITRKSPRRDSSSASRSSIELQPENTDVSLAAKECRADAVYLECGHSHRCWDCAIRKSRHNSAGINSTSSSSNSCSSDNNDAASRSLPSMGSTSRGRSAVRLEVAKRKEEASAGPIGDCGICGRSGQIARVQNTFDCPVCFDSVDLENAFCAGTCGHMCCVACAVQYVRAALGDVGNNVTGEGLRCLFHSMLGGAGGGEACPGILEPFALKLLVGRYSGGQVTAMAEAAAAFSTAVLAEQEARDAEQKAAQARLAAVARASEAFMQQQQQEQQQKVVEGGQLQQQHGQVVPVAPRAAATAAVVDMPRRLPTAPPTELLAASAGETSVHQGVQGGEAVRNSERKRLSSVASSPSWGLASVLPLAPSLISPLTLAASSSSLGFGPFSSKSGSASRSEASTASDDVTLADPSTAPRRVNRGNGGDETTEEHCSSVELSTRLPSAAAAEPNVQQEKDFAPNNDLREGDSLPLPPAALENAAAPPVAPTAAAANLAMAAIGTAGAAATRTAAGEAEDAVAPLSMNEVQRLGRFVYEASIPQPCRFYCTNKTTCGRLFEVEEHLLNSDINQALSEEECRVECPFCDRASCVRCKILFHGALSCSEVQDIEAERASGAGEGGSGGGREKSGLSMELIRATSKPCPSCSMSISHYHGHACHHIAPGTGCVNCGYHFCFSCGEPAGPAIPAGSSGCSCPVYCINDHILSNIKNLPIPHDTRCGCVFCPDCKCTILPAASWDKRRGVNRNPEGAINEEVAGEGMTVVPHPCAQCDGTCVVCIGLVTPREVSVHKSGRLSMAL